MEITFTLFKDLQLWTYKYKGYNYNYEITYQLN